MYAEFFSAVPAAFPLVVGILGLLIGSFLNVVAYRLPLMMERDWRRQCEELGSEEPSGNPEALPEPFDLWQPRSACPGCSAPVAAYDNLPVLSFLLLRGRCRHCARPIGLRYPIVEASAAVLAVVVAWVFGPSWQALAALLVSWTLLALSIIDIDRYLLPDSMTLPLMWGGLLASLIVVDGVPLFVGVRSSVIGAAVGYVSLWSVYQIFKLLTGKEGMGYGDFKLLAALGAWLGWQQLPLVILLSAGAGAVIGTVLLIFGRSRNAPIPFGPYLAIAGWIALLWGENLNNLYLDTFF